MCFEHFIYKTLSVRITYRKKQTLYNTTERTNQNTHAHTLFKCTLNVNHEVFLILIGKTVLFQSSSK